MATLREALAERDSALAELEKAQASSTKDRSKYVGALENMNQLEAERDSARAELEKARGERLDRDHLADLINERDDAIAERDSARTVIHEKNAALEHCWGVIAAKDREIAELRAGGPR